MQINRTFNKRFNKSNVSQFGGYATLIGAPTRFTLTGIYENADLKIKEVLKDLEIDGFRFYRNKIVDFTLDESNEIKSANTQFIEVKAEELPINITNKVVTIGFTDEELTKFKTGLDEYNVQGWGIQIPKDAYQVNEELLKGTDKYLKIRIYNSSYHKGNIKVGILPEIQIFEEII